MKLPPSVKNWISLAGATIVLISLFMIIFLFTVTVILHKQAAYLGLLVYILLPGIMIAGLLIIPLGMYLKIRREKKAGVCAMPGWPHIDLNDLHQRNAAFIFIVGTIFFLFISAVGSYNAFEYTESVSFCGTLCHAVMKPENVAHQNSAHARVSCVACHVGPGVDWYVRSKMSGLYQVYAVASNNFPRPIPTPIENLRPARAVCEQCHWPQKFYAQQYLVRTHYLQDRDNSRWDIGLDLKVGPPEQGGGYLSGIHWHVNPHVQIEYVAADERREHLPWVRFTNLDTGEVKVFQDTENPLTPGELTTAKMRVMDCLDCHNRPSHRYRSPNEFLNLAMTGGELPADLPEFKARATELCAKEYSTSEEALAAISQGLESLYRDQYPDVWQQRRADVKHAVSVVQSAFVRNIFPEMKVSWKAYPDHSAHLESNGCFRCHNGRHHTDSGEVISKDCNLCHNIVDQGPPGSREYTRANESLEFRHPVDIDQAWQEVACADCHREANP
jgi:NapC/NirT cytochrome c family, N-terminal region